MTPTGERFRALARSSPWRWRTLRFTRSWRLPPGWPQRPAVRAWVRRPDALRVETLDGRLLKAARVDPSVPVPLTFGDGPGSGPGSGRTDARIVASRPGELAAELDADGLVAVRPPNRHMLDADPFFEDYFWIAMLDPVELADARDGGPGVHVETVTTVGHHGRPAWEALLRPTGAYNPRCGCCPLLHSAESDAVDGTPTALDRDPAFRYADAHRVRLDVDTGVCVYSEQLGGSRDGSGHELVIEAVDDASFADPARTR